MDDNDNALLKITMRSNNKFVYSLLLKGFHINPIMYPGRALLLPFDSCYSLYGYCLTRIALLTIQEYISTYSVVIIIIHVDRVRVY